MAMGGAGATLALALPTLVRAAPWQLERSEVLTLHAADGHGYRIMVAWPEGPPPAQGWPVLWMLDGEDTFAMAAMTARRLARASVRSGVGEGIIVAVESGSIARRVLDYTPALPGYAIPAGAPAAGLALGGADAFLAFLRERAQPEIARRWSIEAGAQTLAGHSFGGLLALHALAQGQNWSRYAAISPSLWYGNGLIAREVAAIDHGAARSVFLARGGQEKSPTGSPDDNDLTALSAALSARGIAVRTMLLAGHDHGSTLPATVADAITLAFGLPPGKEKA